MSTAVSTTPPPARIEARPRGTANCRTADDLYCLEARQFIGRILAAYLEETHLTPIELLHCYSHALALSNSGSRLSGFVQQAAIAQVASTGQSVAERVRDLFLYTDGVISMSRALTLALDRDPLSAERLNALCAAGGDLKPAFAALANALKDVTEWTAKIERLLNLFDGASTPAALGAFDDILSEFLARAPVLDELYGALESREERIMRLLAMARRAAAPAAVGTPGSCRHRVTVMLIERDLPLCRAVLMAHVKRVMDLPGIFASRSPSEELAALRRMFNLFARVDPAFGRADLMASIEARMGRLITPDAMGKLVPDGSPHFNKIILVLNLIDEVIGDVARGALMKFLDLLFDEGNLNRTLMNSKETPADLAREIDDMVQRINASSIPIPLRTPFVERLHACIGKLHAGSDKRAGLRSPAGLGDYVLLRDERAELVNWSAVGILFGPVKGTFVVDQKLRLAIRVRTYKGPLQFEAAIEVVRVLDGQVAAKYRCVRGADDQAVKAHFAFASKNKKV